MLSQLAGEQKYFHCSSLLCFSSSAQLHQCTPDSFFGAGGRIASLVLLVVVLVLEFLVLVLELQVVLVLELQVWCCHHQLPRPNFRLSGRELCATVGEI